MQTIYNIDYLKSISKEKLLELAKKKSEFNMAFMERKLKMPKDSLRSAIQANTSKYDKKIRKYLINFLTSETNPITCDTNTCDADFNLEELFLEANKYQLVTNVSIAKDLNYSLSTVSLCKTGKNRTKTAYKIKQYLEDIIEKGKLSGELPKDFNLDNLFEKANKYQKVTIRKIAEDLECHPSTISENIHGKRKGHTAYQIKEYLENIIEKSQNVVELEDNHTYEFNLKQLLDEAREHRHLTLTKIAEDLNCSITAVALSVKGESTGKIAHKVRDYLKNIIESDKSNKDILEVIKYYTQENKLSNESNSIQKTTQEESKEQETMTEETLTDTKEMKTYDEFLNFINTQKELPIVKKALDETLSENQNLEKILAKEEFITIETAQELNEKLFANEYTEEEILDFENQYFGTTDNASLKDKIKAFVEKHNLSLETALKLLQISEEDYKKMLEGADKVSNKTADKIYKAITAFDEFYHSEKTQDTINNTKNTFVTGVAIASAKGQTFLNKGLNKFADFLNKSAEKIKNSNSDNKEE